MITIRRRTIGLLLLAFVQVCSATVCGDDPAITATFLDDRTGTVRNIEGRVLIEAVDGGILVEDVQRRLWSITPDRLQSRSDLQQVFAPLDTDALAAAMQDELGNGFTTSRTEHYVVCSNAGDAYVKWVGSLFERLLRAFLQTWKQAGWELVEPSEPLPALIFRTQQEYAAFATQDAGPEVADKAGYYSMRTNRIVLYDLATAGANDAPATRTDVERRVAAAPVNVATIVHEATHQLAFNCGMHTRYADTPMWLAEGLAMYCETPDLRTGSGWRTIGRLNVARLRRYREFAAERRADGSLIALIRDEARFRDPAQMLDAYAESWALVDYLMRERRNEFVTYLRQVAQKPRLRWDAPETRISEFEAVFGPVADVETDCSAHLRRLRAR